MHNLGKELFQYIPISQFDRDWGIFVTGAGYASVPPKSPYPMSTHPPIYHFQWSKGRVLREYQLLYFLRGGGRFESELGGNRTIKPGTCLILFPGVWHRYHPDRKTGWDEYWIGFGGYYADSLTERGFFSKNSPIQNIGIHDSLLKHFLNVLDYIKSEPFGFQQIIAGELMQALAKVLAYVRSPKSGGDAMEAVIRQAKCLLMENLHRNVNMREVAQSLHVGYEHFRRCFKHVTGLAPLQYHQELRLVRAKELLNGTNRSVKSISISLGFENPYYFSNWFKRKTGHSPQFWRQLKQV